MLAAVLLVLTAFAGCTSRSSSEPRQSPGVIDAERVSTDNALPKEFPADVPLPDGRTVLYSAVGPLGVSAYFATPSSDAEVKTFLFDAFAAKEWKLATCQVMKLQPETITIVNFVKGGRVASVVVGYNASYATRIEGRDYSFFVSVTDKSKPPATTAKRC